MDIYTIIFLVLAVFVFLRLRSVIGQRTGKRPFRVSAFTYRLSMIAAVLCAVNYVAYEAKWYSALMARVTPISGLARVIDGDTVVVLLAMTLLLEAALVLSFLQWKDWKVQKLAFERAGIDHDSAVIGDGGHRSPELCLASPRAQPQKSMPLRCPPRAQLVTSRQNICSRGLTLPQSKFAD